MSYFDMVRRCRSVREAARRLNVSASAVNQQILNLEADIGSPLFERLPGGLKLTTAGEVVARHAIAVLRDALRTETELDLLRGIRRGQISLATIESATTDFMPRIIERMYSSYPGVTITVRIAASQLIRTMVLSGEADIGLAFGPLQEPELTSLATASLMLGAIVREDHPLARANNLTLNDCIKFPLFLGIGNKNSSIVMSSLVERYADQLNVLGETNSYDLLQRLVRRLNIVGFQVNLGIEHSDLGPALVHIPFHGLSRVDTELCAFMRSKHFPTPALDAFIQILRDETSHLAAMDH